MSSIVKTMVCNSREMCVDDLTEGIKREIDAELVYERVRYYDSVQVLLLVFERYYFRNGSYAGLTLMITENDGIQNAEIIGSGGGEGIFNFSLGANASFADMAVNALRKFGFQEIE